MIWYVIAGVVFAFVFGMIGLRLWRERSRR